MNGAPASTHEVDRAAACALIEAYALLAQWGREKRPTDPPPSDREASGVGAPKASERRSQG